VGKVGRVGGIDGSVGKVGKVGSVGGIAGREGVVTGGEVVKGVTHLTKFPSGQESGGE